MKQIPAGVQYKDHINLDSSSFLTLSSIYTHFNTLKEKALFENTAKKGEIAQNEQFHLFPQCFLCNLYFDIL